MFSGIRPESEMVSGNGPAIKQKKPFLEKGKALYLNAWNAPGSERKEGLIL